ncbi:A-kinase anchor protein 17A-like [Papaver somniferum]|uniref:A-kinase anchor protein 17A-like n=1 Tax=Papaver somniferum TaxID=3469 RepID=UPI000E6FFCAD|nr:A-kinase anchor protein 17A-like [Papaver somniferum]
MSSRNFKSIAPTETLEIDNGLSVVPRVKLVLTIYRSDRSVKPVDEWQLKRSLLDYLKKSSFTPPLNIPEEDLEIHSFKDIKKRKREDPVAAGTLYVRDLGFIHHKEKAEILLEKKKEEGDDEEWKVLEKKFVEWRNSFVKKLDGIELSLQGVKFKANAVLPISDDFNAFKISWEEFFAFDRGVFARIGKRQPDTIILRGVPSRWFAETRVSSEPSVLVSHTIFSVFGTIRNLNAAVDVDLVKNGEEGEESIASGLQCKIVVQYEKYDDFCNALKVLCGRSMQKQGSRLRAEYEVTWDKGEFFRNSLQRNGRLQDTVEQHNKRPSIHSRLTQDVSEGSHPKRFKD